MSIHNIIFMENCRKWSFDYYHICTVSLLSFVLQGCGFFSRPREKHAKGCDNSSTGLKIT